MQGDPGRLRGWVNKLIWDKNEEKREVGPHSRSRLDPERADLVVAPAHGLQGGIVIAQFTLTAQEVLTLVDSHTTLSVVLRNKRQQHNMSRFSCQANRNVHSFKPLLTFVKPKGKRQQMFELQCKNLNLNYIFLSSWWTEFIELKLNSKGC